MALPDDVTAALIGFVGGLLGAGVGGWFTLIVTRIQIKSEREQADRERLDAAADRRETARDRERERREIAKDRERERREQQLYAALQNFKGGTQRRNIGIAVIEQYWSILPEMRPILRPLLINQAIYLLKESKQVRD